MTLSRFSYQIIHIQISSAPFLVSFTLQFPWYQPLLDLFINNIAVHPLGDTFSPAMNI